MDYIPNTHDDSDAAPRLKPYLHLGTLGDVPENSTAPRSDDETIACGLHNWVRGYSIRNRESVRTTRAHDRDTPTGEHAGRDSRSCRSLETRRLGMRYASHRVGLRISFRSGFTCYGGNRDPTGQRSRKTRGRRLTSLIDIRTSGSTEISAIGTRETKWCKAISRTSSIDYRRCSVAFDLSTQG